MDAARLCAFEEAALQYCKSHGVTDLGMLYQQESAFSAALKLKPLERKRLRKALGRSGDSVPLTKLPAEHPQAPEAELIRPLTSLTIAGLGEVLLEARLEHVCVKAQRWCEATGAVYLDEVREHAAHFSDFLGLLPDARDRLFLALKIDTPLPARKKVGFTETREADKLEDSSEFQKSGKSISTKSIRSVTSTSSAECLIETFEILDEEGTGLVKPETLRAWFATLGMELCDEEHDFLAEYGNADQNGLIDYAAFIRTMTKSPCSPLSP